jgi:hypothetical protein
MSERRPSTALDDIARHEAGGNRLTQPLRALYAGHRQRTTAALFEAAAGGRLCLLGAGNGNDVDLAALAARFDEVRLADLDRAAVERNLQRQAPDVRRRCRTLAPIELSGMLEALAAWRAAPPTLSQIEQASAQAHESVAAGLAGPYDVVASTCLLTQLSWAADHLLGRTHPMLRPVREALLASHLRLLATLAAPGGSALVISDAVSSRTLPIDELPGDANLAEVLRQATAANNFYPGANPRLLRTLPRRDPFLAARLDAGTWLDPWLWQGPAERTYLVLAVRFRRR